jgi:glutaredoxin
MNHVVVFTMKGCPHCTEFKELLVKENIEFVDADIDDNSDEYGMFVKVTENEFIPAIMIVNEETKDAKFYAPDRDFEDLNQAVNLIKESF